MNGATQNAVIMHAWAQVHHMFFRADEFQGKDLLATMAPGQVLELVRLCTGIIVDTRPTATTKAGRGKAKKRSGRQDELQAAAAGAGAAARSQ